jgi:hypothetical protein
MTNRPGGAAFWESLVEDDPIDSDTTEKPRRQQLKTEGVRKKGWYEPGITRPTSIRMDRKPGGNKHPTRWSAPGDRWSRMMPTTLNTLETENRKTGCLKT